MPEVATAEQIFSVLADRISLSMLKMAYSGVKISITKNNLGISKKQFYFRLKRLRDIGLVEKRDSVYRTTTLGSLIYNSHVKTLEEALGNYWQLKAIDVLRAKPDFPAHQKDAVINEIINASNLRHIVNSTHLSGFSVIKDFNSLIHEVMKLLENAQKEVFLASRYHDPFVSQKLIEKFGKGVEIHLLDGNQPNVSMENRVNAILKVPPNKETFDIVSNLIKSPRFHLASKQLPVSFLVVDGIQCIYEAVNYTNPEEFTMAMAHYDDPYLAQRLTTYFKLLSKDAVAPKFVANKLERR